jgi:hypothetical protein
MSDDTGSWTPGLLVVGGVLLDAAEAVAADESVRAVLKVRSGEHLAAIFLSALLGRTPSGFDHDGGLTSSSMRTINHGFPTRALPRSRSSLFLEPTGRNWASSCEKTGRAATASCRFPCGSGPQRRS